MRKSLRLRLIAVIALLSAILLAAEGFFSLSITQTAYKDLLDDDYEADSKYYGASVDGWMLKNEGYMNSILAMIYAADSTTDQENLIKVLTSVTQNNDEISMAYVGFASGNLLNGSKWTPPAGWSCLTRDWYKDAVEADGEYVYSAPYVDDNTGDIIVTMSKYFKYPVFSGVAAFDINLSVLCDKLNKMVDEHANEGEYVIVSASDGTIISHPNEDFLPTVDELTNFNTILGGEYAKQVKEDEEFEDYDGTICYVTQVTCDVTGWDLTIVSPIKYYDGEVNANKNKVFVVFVICLVIAIVVASLLGWFVTRPIKKASSAIARLITSLKNGEGNLTHHVRTSSKDEVGVLVKGVNSLIDEMRDIITGTSGATQTISAGSVMISSQVENANSEVENISATMQQMSASSEETAASMGQIMTQIDEVAALTNDVMKQSEQQVQHANSVAKRVDKILKESEVTIRESNERLDVVANDLKKKIDNAKNVNEIANLTAEILSITEQTNLLSLNASIEAARAGEAGKGFAVVADEIRKLADSSASAAERIQQVTENVIYAVEELAAEAENVTEFMVQSNIEGHKQTGALTKDYGSDIASLASAMNGFLDNSCKIQESMQIISESVAAVNVASEENTRGIITVAESTQTLSQNLNEIVKKIVNNNEEVSGLEQKMSRFEV